LGDNVNKLEENIRLLAIFHYVLAALIAFFACIPIIHIVIGILFLVAPETMCEGGCDDTPPEFIGWLFVGIGAFVMLVGWILAVLVALAGRFLSRRIHYKFCIAIAAAMCLFMPLGTILGVFTLITILKPETEALFTKK